jgi:hypothetical protein
MTVEEARSVFRVASAMRIQFSRELRGARRSYAQLLYGYIRGAKTRAEGAQALRAVEDDYIQAVEDEIVAWGVYYELLQGGRD